MLVLSRKETQRIRVGDSIVVTIVKVAGDKVRVGIEAPSDVLVLRDELEAWEENSQDLPNSEAPVQRSTNNPCSTKGQNSALVAVQDQTVASDGTYGERKSA